MRTGSSLDLGFPLSCDPPGLIRAEFASPMGRLIAMVKNDTLVGLMWPDREEATLAHLNRHRSMVRAIDGDLPGSIAEPLSRYFSGSLKALSAIEVDPAGTAFQRRVWRDLQAIPPGTAASYADVAARLGCPTAVRAVANANGRNPIPIVIPCHRVIATGGGLGGFSSGADRKEWLLRHERFLTG